jgi:nitrogen fixation/metabolism regulation signal transduction histidine kinase
MSKKWTLIWLTLIFALFLVLAIYTFHKHNPLFLIGCEIVIPLLYALTIWMVLSSLKPITTIGRSLNLLKEGEFNITLVKTGNKDVDNIIGVYNSMINRLREERLSVREKNHFLDLLIESSPLGIVIVDLDDRITDINRAAYKYMGIQLVEYKGKYLNDLNCSLAQEIEKINYDEKQLVVLSDGQKFLCRKLFFMDHGFRHPFYLIEEFTDEIKKAEKEAYNKLIRMMAHEVNNTIGSVNSIMSAVQSDRDLFVGPEREDIVRVLGVAIQRNYQLNRFMQNLSNVVKLPPPEKEPMDLRESLMIVLESFSSILKEKNISLTTRMCDSSAIISADRSQIEQVFINIIKNSIEAINNGGHIIVSLKASPVCICFEDDGTGLTKEANERIFTPFFSTKPGGQGIGLTLVHEILTNHGFSFSLLNRESGGVEFIIRF